MLTVEATREKKQTPAPLAVFVARCEAQAILAAHGQVELADAVDTLQEAAVRAGLVDELGHDAVQHILADAFARCLCTR